MRQSEIGACRVWLKEDQDAFSLHPSEYERLKYEFMAGGAFFVGRELYGDEIVIKLSSVVAILHVSPEAVTMSANDRAAQEQEERGF